MTKNPDAVTEGKRWWMSEKCCLGGASGIAVCDLLVGHSGVCRSANLMDLGVSPRTPNAVTAAVEAAKSSPIAKGADAFGRLLLCECGNPECDRPHYCDECGDELPMGETGICRPCYREDPMNNPRVDEDRS